VRSLRIKNSYTIALNKKKTGCFIIRNLEIRHVYIY
jgi:hypothetical protein